MIIKKINILIYFLYCGVGLFAQSRQLILSKEKGNKQFLSFQINIDSAAYEMYLFDANKNHKFCETGIDEIGIEEIETGKLDTYRLKATNILKAKNHYYRVRLLEYDKKIILHNSIRFLQMSIYKAIILRKY